MQSEQSVKKKFNKLHKGIQLINQLISDLLPNTVVKEASTFGNSSHVVLPKEFLDKKIGIVVLQDKESVKGGEK